MQCPTHALPQYAQPDVFWKYEKLDFLGSQTQDNTRRNSLSLLKRSLEDVSDSKNGRPNHVEVVKRSCSFSNWTQVRIIAEAEEENEVYEKKFLRVQSCPSFLFASWGDNVESMVEPSATQNEMYTEQFSRSQSCPSFLFASWNDNVESMLEASTAHLAVKSTLSILDLEETKQEDGPEAASLLVANLIDDAVSATCQQLLMLKAHLGSCNSHLTLNVEKFAAMAPRLSVNKLEPAMMTEVYARIQKIVTRVEQAGSVGLLPQAVQINTSHLPVLNYLLLKLHRAALAKLHTAPDYQE